MLSYSLSAEQADVHHTALSRSGPLLAIQTIIAEGGLWYAKSVPPLMASSSAVAFEHLNSRGGTPTPNMTLLPPTSLTQPNSASTDITQATAQSTITSTATSSHRSSSSNDSVSSLASIAAFSNPAPGTFRHSLDTQDAPSTMLGRALAMAAPYPKLQIMKNKGVRDSHNIENIDVENGLPGDPELRKRESRKLKSYSMSRYSVISQHSIRSQEQQRGRKRSNTLGMSSGLEKSWEDVENAGEFGLRTPHRRRSALAIKDANSLTAAILAEKKRTPPRSPSVSSFTFRSSQGTSAHERRRSAPITPSSYKTVDESGILVSRYTDASSYNIDSLTASLLTSMLPGMRISTSALSTSDKRNSLHRSMSRDTTDDHREVTNTTATKSRPNLSLDISAKDSTFAKCDETSVGDSRQYSNGSPTEYLAKAKASGNDSQKPQQSRQGQHLRRRSRKSISYALPDDDELDHQTKKANHLPIDATNITTRRGGKSRLTPAVEEREEKVALPPAPRPSLEESYEVVDQHPIGDDSGLEVSFPDDLQPNAQNQMAQLSSARFCLRISLSTLPLHVQQITPHRPVLQVSSFVPKLVPLLRARTMMTKSVKSQWPLASLEHHQSAPSCQMAFYALFQRL